MPRTRFTSDLEKANTPFQHGENDAEDQGPGAAPRTADNTNISSSDERSAEDSPTGGEKPGTYVKYEITEEDCYDELGFSFPTWKKWYILTVIFWVQVSMNFNTSLYSNAIGGISEEFSVSEQAGRCGAMIFLVLYAFGWWVPPFVLRMLLQLSFSPQWNPPNIEPC